VLYRFLAAIMFLGVATLYSVDSYATDKFALIVGDDRDNDVPSANVKEIGESLRRVGYETTVNTDVEHNGLAEIVKDFAKSINTKKS